MTLARRQMSWPGGGRSFALLVLLGCVSIGYATRPDKQSTSDVISEPPQVPALGAVNSAQGRPAAEQGGVVTGGNSTLARDKTVQGMELSEEGDGESFSFSRGVKRALRRWRKKAKAIHCFHGRHPPRCKKPKKNRLSWSRPISSARSIAESVFRGGKKKCRRKDTSKCTCDKGWTGKQCRCPVCLNGGIRSGSPDSFPCPTCTCQHPYYGDHCQHEYKQCDINCAQDLGQGHIACTHTVGGKRWCKHAEHCQCKCGYAYALPDCMMQKVRGCRTSQPIGPLFDDIKMIFDKAAKGSGQKDSGAAGRLAAAWVLGDSTYPGYAEASVDRDTLKKVQPVNTDKCWKEWYTNEMGHYTRLLNEFSERLGITREDVLTKCTNGDDRVKMLNSLGMVPVKTENDRQRLMREGKEFLGFPASMELPWDKLKRLRQQHRKNMRWDYESEFSDMLKMGHEIGTKVEGTQKGIAKKLGKIERKSSGLYSRMENLEAFTRYSREQKSVLSMLMRIRREKTENRRKYLKHLVQTIHDRFFKRDKDYILARQTEEKRHHKRAFDTSQRVVGRINDLRKHVKALPELPKNMLMKVTHERDVERAVRKKAKEVSARHVAKIEHSIHEEMAEQRETIHKRLRAGIDRVSHDVENVKKEALAEAQDQIHMQTESAVQSTKGQMRNIENDAAHVQRKNDEFMDDLKRVSKDVDDAVQKSKNELVMVREAGTNEEQIMKKDAASVVETLKGAEDEAQKLVSSMHSAWSSSYGKLMNKIRKDMDSARNHLIQRADNKQADFEARIKHLNNQMSDMIKIQQKLVGDLMTQKQALQAQERKMSLEKEKENDIIREAQNRFDLMKKRSEMHPMGIDDNEAVKAMQKDCKKDAFNAIISQMGPRMSAMVNSRGNLVKDIAMFRYVLATQGKNFCGRKRRKGEMELNESDTGVSHTPSEAIAEGDYRSLAKDPLRVAIIQSIVEDYGLDAATKDTGESMAG